MHGSNESHGHVHSNRALVVEDIRAAELHLKTKGYECDRITHNEFLSSAGTEYTGKLLSGLYSLLWIATPSDWHVRTTTKKTATHWQTIQRWLIKASMLGMLTVVFGPPGFL